MERKIDEFILELYTKIVAFEKEKEPYEYDEQTRRANGNKISCLNTQINLCREVVKRLQEISGK